MPTCRSCESAMPYGVVACPVCGTATGSSSEMISGVVQHVREALPELPDLSGGVLMLATGLVATLLLQRCAQATRHEGDSTNQKLHPFQQLQASEASVR